MDTFTNRFASLLAERGWTAEEAARHLPVSAVAVRGWAGQAGVRPVVDPKASHLLAMCALFTVRPEWLMHGEMPREPLAEAWPFITPRARIESLPPLVRALLDRIIFDVTEILSSGKIS